MCVGNSGFMYYGVVLDVVVLQDRLQASALLLPTLLRTGGLCS